MSRSTAAAVSQDLARPGFASVRLVRLSMAAIDRLRLDLGGVTLLTEAASGAYATTAVLAAMAGARRVYAVARDNRFGSSEYHAAQTLALAAAAGVEDRIEIVTSDPYAVARESQIVTNSGSLRPIDAALIRQLPAEAVIALMYEAWELRPGDIDIEAAAARGIPVVGVNEQHPRIDVFSYLGPLAVRELHDAGIAVYGCHIAVVCDNSFAPPIVHALESLGARVSLAQRCEELPRETADAVLVALRPTAAPVIGATQVPELAERTGRAPIVQLWGDVDREAMGRAGIAVWPPAAPPAGHMAVLFPEIGPEAVIRLQSGGLSAAERVLRSGPAAAGGGSEATLLTGAAVPAGLPS